MSSRIPKLNLPTELEIYRKQIERTVKPFIKISTSKGQTKIFQSKLGGLHIYLKLWNIQKMLIINQ
ncbi:uncharacterized protein YwqG [Evansella vedderi]|uniref:Uncharacterized protein YwqG n=1 Tax=Evansella vedderi TaxID=38282 RepID=A0ABU0A0V5_9BACI|nr:uncharacterized protein YwqG [Evansella vedderi]